MKHYDVDVCRDGRLWDAARLGWRLPLLLSDAERSLVKLLGFLGFFGFFGGDSRVSASDSSGSNPANFSLGIKV